MVVSDAEAMPEGEMLLLLILTLHRPLGLPESNCQSLTAGEDNWTTPGQPCRHP